MTIDEALDKIGLGEHCFVVWDNGGLASFLSLRRRWLISFAARLETTVLRNRSASTNNMDEPMFVSVE